MKGYCDRCKTEAEITASSVGRVHQACGRKKGNGSKRSGGKWAPVPAPKEA